MTAIFIILAALTIAGAAAAMSLRNLIHSVLALVLAFAGLAGLYLALGAQFLGFAQILVYIGAVAILAVFAILLTRSTEDSNAHSSRIIREPAPPPAWIQGVAIATAVFAVLAWTTVRSSASHNSILPAPAVGVRQIGVALMGRFVLPLEVLGILLTGALVGAVIIALHESAP